MAAPRREPLVCPLVWASCEAGKASLASGVGLRRLLAPARDRLLLLEAAALPARALAVPLPPRAEVEWATGGGRWEVTETTDSEGESARSVLWVDISSD